MFLPLIHALWDFPKWRSQLFTPFERSQTTNPRGLGHLGENLDMEMFLSTPIHGRTVEIIQLLEWLIIGTIYHINTPFLGYYVIYGLLYTFLTKMCCFLPFTTGQLAASG